METGNGHDPSHPRPIAMTFVFLLSSCAVNANSAPAGQATVGQAAASQLPTGVPARVEVTYLPNEKVSAVFAKGGPLFGAENYKIMAGHRDGSGRAELHTLDTDIFYVVDGEATFVTGGEMVAPAPDQKPGQPADPTEIRAASIQGGDSHRLTKGDVIVIPRGVPHWYSDVKPGFLYFVVKVR
jgi:quercetin dioxygenase-like cupin family protein